MAVVLYKYTYLLNLNLDLLLYWFYRCALPRAVSAATAVASLYYLLLVLWPLGLILVLVLATYTVVRTMFRKRLSLPCYSIDSAIVFDHYNNTVSRFISCICATKPYVDFEPKVYPCNLQG